MAIYAAGIALNDVFDYEIDLKERPGRPLPSGRVSRRFAAWTGGGLLLLGPVLAAASPAARWQACSLPWLWPGACSPTTWA